MAADVSLPPFIQAFSRKGLREAPNGEAPNATNIPMTEAKVRACPRLNTGVAMPGRGAVHPGCAHRSGSDFRFTSREDASLHWPKKSPVRRIGSGSLPRSDNLSEPGAFARTIPDKTRKTVRNKDKDHA
jgi:hypothetical protein